MMEYCKQMHGGLRLGVLKTIRMQHNLDVTAAMLECEWLGKSMDLGQQGKSKQKAED